MSFAARPRRRLIAPAMAAALALGLTACGNDGGDGVADADPTTAVDAGTAAPDSTEDLEEMVEGMTEDLEAQQDAEGGGSATLTAGDQTWDFDSVLCAFGEEEIGQEGAEFVLSSIQDGLQFYVSIDEFGHFVSINDIEDFENPSVALSNDGAAEEFITLDGKNLSGQVTMVDEEGAGNVEASFEGTCP
ncbi:MAG: hypothetical protein ABR500_07935 [Dermatophilaceae bacterium]|nr:hypothetical protein [Intrasporangiaceae bacterium]